MNIRTNLYVVVVRCCNQLLSIVLVVVQVQKLQCRFMSYFPRVPCDTQTRFALKPCLLFLHFDLYQVDPAVYCGSLANVLYRFLSKVLPRLARVRVVRGNDAFSNRFLPSYLALPFQLLQL